MPDSPTNHYWADLPSDEFVQAYFEKIGTGGQNGSLGYLARLQLLAHRHYYGALPTGFVGDMVGGSSAEVSRGGDQGENVELRVNWLRAHVNAKHQIIVAPKLAWGTQPANTDSRSMADAARGATILESEWKQGNAEMKCISAQLGSILYGEEFVFTYWDKMAGEPVSFDESSGQVEYEGDVVTHQVLPWNVFRDPTAGTFADSNWLSARRLVDRWELIAQYPDFKEEIKAAPTPASVQIQGIQSVNIAVNDPNKVLCHYFFHRRSAAMPLGLQAVFLSPTCVMEFDALEKCYWHLPIHQFSSGELKGTPWSYTDLWEAMASQDLASDIQSSLATNIVSFAKQLISAEADQDLNVNDIGNGPKVIYRQKGSPAPTPVQLTAQPAEGFKHLDSLKSDQRLQLGLNDVAMGEAPTGAPNAQAWALLSTAAITANSGAQRSWVKGVQSVGRGFLEIFKEKVSAKRKTAVVGVHGAAVPKQEEWDSSDLSPLDDVTVDIANPLAQNPAGRLQIAQMHMDAGFVQTPEQLQMVTEQGTLQPMTQVLRDELIYIAFENEEILQGRNPPVKISDSHQMHIREHRGPTFSADGRGDPAVNTAGDAHVQAHLQFLLNTDPRILAIMGQAAPPPGQPPGGAPPSGQGTDPGTPATPGAMQSPLAAQQGEAAGIKLPSAPTNPATGAQAAPPGIPQ